MYALTQIIHADEADTYTLKNNGVAIFFGMHLFQQLDGAGIVWITLQYVLKVSLGYNKLIGLQIQLG